MALSKLERRQRIKYRIRKVITGTTAKPRLSVFRSNKEIYAQLIDDVTGVTLASASSRDKEITAGSKSEAAAAVGKAIAEKAAAKGFETISFDRNGFLYHGRIKVLAEAAREAGLKF
ncbi:50S ribosomal protein L18 [Tenacibaculum finnmarkense genomovar finnmarkense]|uniref:Large ribosomal subunit protein uL18 n=1 Tax=Tenacibaculum finnmarkense genomovar finnmarkense TaxID=1458503 RepID=A0AAP1RG10_9FLAO|nr:50S ribosomal protein L18 [Tenacibaculum finnmarkense]MBE7652961.1 50S ribosomal protein L18 [Tenacibaculum finnmarkense genomovar finnmarkense]MBE7660410.1 50S ribosomal protein L18 [Tenacibaculum finnmarkense genomovar finnmarkense]MBE7692364.1 50S ribosomal protein L18 [Tenacibaculum finnmarkense genomovar finnmarkense]MBE7695262.1 50S ribosomal protein L18 [Tenacibaculum finnmarkense genomovar finnmarkense]MCD8402526.1 50S ribosomal protein L18 [Tenacibaculum finnmarkense genomovar finn